MVLRRAKYPVVAVAEAVAAAAAAVVAVAVVVAPPCPRHQETFVESIYDLGPEQIVYEPTREGGVLNLVLTNSPDLITDSCVFLVCLTNATLRILSTADTCPVPGQAQLKRCQELQGYDRHHHHKAWKEELLQGLNPAKGERHHHHKTWKKKYFKDLIRRKVWVRTVYHRQSRSSLPTNSPNSCQSYSRLHSVLVRSQEVDRGPGTAVYCTTHVSSANRAVTVLSP